MNAVGAGEVASFQGPRNCGSVEGVVISATPTPAPAVTPSAVVNADAARPSLASAGTPAAVRSGVQCNQQGRQLRRTGTDAVPLSELELGLALVGAAALLVGRSFVATA